MIENTHNRGGGIIFPTSETRAICEAARSLGVKSYLDGARLFNVVHWRKPGLARRAPLTSSQSRYPRGSAVRSAR